MAKIVWIKCKQVVEYNQQHTVTDKEYELLKDLDMENICNYINRDYDDDERRIYRIISGYIDATDIYGSEDEYTDVTIELDKPKKAKKK